MRYRVVIALAGVLALAGCGGHTHSIVVPRVNGSPLEVALTRLHQAGLRATFDTAEMTCGYTELPRVARQQPRAGTRVRAGTAVAFKFAHEFIPSGGGGNHGFVAVPRLVDKDQKAIARVMVHVPIWACVHIRRARATDATRLVLVRQKPAPGTRVPANGVHKNHGFHPTTVTLYYEAQVPGSSPVSSSGYISESQIVSIAKQAAAKAGDPSPTLIQHSAATTRAQANLVDSGDVVPGDKPSYLIAVRGQFVGNEHPPGGSDQTRKGSVLTLVVNATTGEVTDGGFGDTYPDLAKLGPVTTDLKTSSHRRAPTTSGTSPTPANQPALDKAAGDARALAGAAYYTEAAIDLTSNTVDVYLHHAPKGVLDRLQALHPGVYVFHNTAAHPRSALLRLESSISAKVSYWNAHGVRISSLGPRRDGYLEIGVTSDISTARSKLISAYGANWVRVVHGKPAFPVSF